MAPCNPRCSGRALAGLAFVAALLATAMFLFISDTGNARSDRSNRIMLRGPSPTSTLDQVASFRGRFVGRRVFFAANLYNNEALVEGWMRELVVAVSLLVAHGVQPADMYVSWEVLLGVIGKEVGAADGYYAVNPGTCRSTSRVPQTARRSCSPASRPS
jgi:hypothetical protein